MTALLCTFRDSMGAHLPWCDDPQCDGKGRLLCDCGQHPAVTVADDCGLILCLACAARAMVVDQFEAVRSAHLLMVATFVVRRAMVEVARRDAWERRGAA